MHPRTDIHAKAHCRGYTLVTMLIVVTIVAASLALGLPAFQNWIQRARVEGFGRNMAALMHQSRGRAILDAVEVTVVLDEDRGEIFAFLDRNGAVPGSPGDGLFNPVEGAPPGTTDQKLGGHFLPGGVGFVAPPSEQLVDGLTAVAGGRAAIFTTDGAVRDPGAFRFGDTWGNYLEVRIAPAATARVALRKYKEIPGPPSERWLSRDNGPWEWYWGKGRKGGN